LLSQVHRTGLPSAESQHSLPSSKLPLEAKSAQQLFVGSFMKWVSMAVRYMSLRSPCAMPSVSWSGVKPLDSGAVEMRFLE
jgi:hypothetical protein